MAMTGFEFDGNVRCDMSEKYGSSSLWQSAAAATAKSSEEAEARMSLMKRSGSSLGCSSDRRPGKRGFSGRDATPARGKRDSSSTVSRRISPGSSPCAVRVGRCDRRRSSRHRAESGWRRGRSCCETVRSAGLLADRRGCRRVRRDLDRDLLSECYSRQSVFTSANWAKAPLEKIPGAGRGRRRCETGWRQAACNGYSYLVSGIEGGTKREPRGRRPMRGRGRAGLRDRR